MIRKFIHVLIVLSIKKSSEATNASRTTSVVFKLAKERFSESVASQFQYFPVWEVRLPARTVLQCSTLCLLRGGRLCKFFEVRGHTCRMFAKPELEDVARMDQGQIFYSVPSNLLN